ncbi:glucose/arabinose dehydrogenase [Kutzneria buriramensis]|uniref:Glucose/arabinose dehydrogenase n=2 Tax=Kutzneria buriramensis TaxID=1045776 RepID=A0A3E0HB94_9PSEU|nr:glucose/arabinose dehydrogenase [Kutzneria buriramensis]
MSTHSGFTQARLRSGIMRSASRVVATSVALGLLLAGCASFPDQGNGGNAQSWQPQPKLTDAPGPQPNAPGSGSDSGGTIPGPGGGSRTPVPPPQGCTDFDANVIGTCMAPLAAVAALPGGATGLAAERTTGRVLAVQHGADPKPVATIAVDASTDGGLTGLALSPTYQQDQLVYAYVTTATDNRIMRFAVGDVPKAVLTGIPKGPKHNRGVLAVDRSGALLVATGDAGNPAAASDPTSLAGKVLRIDGFGHAASGNPNPASPVVVSGLQDPGGMCTAADGSSAWVTDQTDAADQLFRITPGQPQLGSPAWTWPDRPGVAGCAAFTDEVSVATVHKPGLQVLSLAKTGGFSGRPSTILDGQGGYGLIGAMDVIDQNTLLVGTVNKDGGKPVSSDDRAIVLPKPNGSSPKD